MGTWGTGPFDNDTAADFAGDLDDAPPGERERLSGESWPVPSVPRGTWMRHKRLWPLRP